MKVVITSGYFNPVHSGHINLFKEAKKLGDFLYVIINNDEQAKIKGSIQFMSEQERLSIIQSVKYVDEATLSIDKDKTIVQSLGRAALKFKGNELFFAKGGDRNMDNIPKSERQACQEFGITIISNVGGGKVQSSSWLINNIINKLFNIKLIRSKIENIKLMNVLGNKVAMVQMQDVIELMYYWIENKREKNHWIVATGMHGVVEAARDKSFQKVLNASDLWVADGISLVWLARLNGFNLRRRVTGPDLFREFLRFSDKKGYKHYFYGDTDTTLAVLQKKLKKELPNVETEYFSPPFRALTVQEEKEIIKKINKAKPDVLWVGLGLPKQETWIFEHKDQLQVPVIVGVGAAFKFEAGLVKRAPAWIGDIGFEWLWRLLVEPRTTWRRVFIDAPLFIFLVFTHFFRGAKRRERN